MNYVFNSQYEVFKTNNTDLNTDTGAIAGKTGVQKRLNYGKRLFIHILLTLDTVLNSLALLFTQKNKKGSMCKQKPIHNSLTNTAE